MKSSFLMSVLLGALVTGHVFGQTSTSKGEKSAYQKFSDRLSISYFGAFTSPTLEDWNSSNAAMSPQWGDTGRTCTKNCDTWGMNLWNQVNFGYNFGAKMKFNIIPRFAIFFNNSPDMDTALGEDRATVMIDDTLVGFSGVVYTSDDKTFSWWMRPGLRLPTSKFYRNYDNGDFGTVTYQPDWVNTFTWDPNKTWQYGMTIANRLWVFEERFNNSRHRITFNPWISYAVDDKTKVQTYFEYIVENNKRYESINGKKPIYYDMWQNLMVGVSRDITSDLNVMPFISTFVDDAPYSMRSFWLGAWIAYTIK